MSKADDLYNMFGGRPGQDSGESPPFKGKPFGDMSAAEKHVRGLYSTLSRKDEGFDYDTGVQNMTFRAGYSRMDTPEERQAYLNRFVGQDGWTTDSHGAIALTPQGLKQLGQESQLPVVIDERGLSKADIADLAGAAPGIAGAVGMGAMASGMGTLPGMGLTALGAAGGKAVDEVVESLQGYNLQGPGDVGKDLAIEGGMAALGEGLYRGTARWAGRRALAPEAHRMTPDAERLLDESMALGARPNVTQVTKAPILGRTQSMLNRIFGDPNAAQNAAALKAEMDRLASAYGTGGGRAEAGEAAVQGISRARRALSQWSNRAYGTINEAVGGQPVVPTGPLKQMANGILRSLPKKVREEVVDSPIVDTAAKTLRQEVVKKEGAPVFASNEVVRFLRDIADLDDFMTIDQAKMVRNQLYDAIDEGTIIPGISSNQARRLYKAASQAIREAPDAGRMPPDVADVLRQVDDTYRQRISQFDNSVIKRIMLDPKFAGRIEPARLVDTIFRKHSVEPIKRVMAVLKEPQRKAIQRQAMEDILAKTTRRADDPLNAVFDGKGFLNTLDSYGRDTLEAMFGPQKTQELYRLGEVMQFVTQKMAMSGGLVAAHIALHPWQNLGRLVQMNLLSRFMNTDQGLKWLTKGYEAKTVRELSDFLGRTISQIMAQDNSDESVYMRE